MQQRSASKKVMLLNIQIYVFVAGLVYSQTSGCEVGWFGSSCQYKCRCIPACQSDGSCTPGSSCQNGWFGPACQYSDLAARVPVVIRPGGTQIGVITDGDDMTCNPDTTSQSLTLTWSQSYLIIWMRAYGSSFGQLKTLSVHFSSNSGATHVNVKCTKSDPINSPFMDIYCDLGVPVNHVVLSGEAVKSLCSLYISGGRNIALHQKTSQSSIYVENSVYYGSEKAVDGNTDGIFLNNSCTATNNFPFPYWSIRLSRPGIVYRYVLYNREDLPSVQYRLQGFQLTSFDVNNDPIYNYTDISGREETVYNLLPERPTVALSRVTIQLNRPEYLTLCEFEIYGDTECVDGRYGLDCEHTCNCANTGAPCFASTGTCPSGCAEGFHGDGCTQRCDVGWFGPSCQYKCRCTVSCERDGSCTPGSECQKGWFGPACQYADLAYNVAVTTQPGGHQIRDITDSNDATCNTDRTLQSLALTLSQNYLITWIRLYTRRSYPSTNLTVQFSSNSGNPFLTVICDKMVSSNSHSMDIICNLTVPVNHLVLTGQAVKSLCSLYISGGRNVALRQQTSQSRTYVEDSVFYGSDKAVDGNTNRNFNHKSCTAANDSTVPFWSIRLSTPVTVYRYVLYNREDLQERLQGFRLAAFDDKDAQVYNYTETCGRNQSVYTLLPRAPAVSVSHVNIQLNRPAYLTLCEVEIYGETQCVGGRYGRDCEHTCNCVKTSEKCFVSTGGCTSGYAAGSHGVECSQHTL